MKIEKAWVGKTGRFLEPILFQSTRDGKGWRWGRRGDELCFGRADYLLCLSSFLSFSLLCFHNYLPSLTCSVTASVNIPREIVVNANSHYEAGYIVGSSRSSGADPLVWSENQGSHSSALYRRQKPDREAHPLLRNGRGQEGVQSLRQAERNAGSVLFPVVRSLPRVHGRAPRPGRWSGCSVRVRVHVHAQRGIQRLR